MVRPESFANLVAFLSACPVSGRSTHPPDAVMRKRTTPRNNPIGLSVELCAPQVLYKPKHADALCKLKVEEER